MQTTSKRIASTSFGLSGTAGSVAVCAQIVLLFTLSNLPTPLYRDYARAYHFSVLTLTLIFATYVVGTLLTLGLFGRLSDQIGRKPVSLAAIAIAIVTGVLFGFVQNVPMLFVARLFAGIAAGLSSGTAIAWMRDINENRHENRAALITVAANVFGLGMGPLFGGVLAQISSRPLTVPFLAFIALAVPLVVAIAATKETVMERCSLKKISLVPRIGVPRNLRLAFLAPGITTFVLYALVGFYAAITPGIIAKTLNITSYAATGAIVFELFAIAALSVFAGRALSDRIAMIGGAAMMLPALAFLVLAQMAASLPALLLGTAIGGIALGLGWRGALHLTGELAPEHKRAELVSALFVCGNLGMAVPVIGIGLLASFTTPQLANYVFSGVVAALSIAGITFGATHRQGR